MTGHVCIKMVIYLLSRSFTTFYGRTKFSEFFLIIIMVICEIKWSYDFLDFFQVVIFVNLWSMMNFKICLRPLNPIFDRKHIFYKKKNMCAHFNSYMTFKEIKIIWPLYFTNDHENQEKIWKICATLKSCKWPWKFRKKKILLKDIF